MCSSDLFVPAPLPPDGPPLVLDGAVSERLQAAAQALARLELAGEMVPSLDWFIYAFVRKEAVVSSQIEGIQAKAISLGCELAPIWRRPRGASLGLNGDERR